jgi:hypothetical protein
LSCNSLILTKPVFTFIPQTSVKGQVGRRPHLLSQCFLNPFQSPGYSHFSSCLEGVFWKKKVPFQHSWCLISNPALPSGDSKWVDYAALFLLVFPQGLVTPVPWVPQNWVQGKGIGLVCRVFLNFF